MKIHTTITSDYNNYQKIKKAADIHRTSISKIISSLLNYLIENEIIDIIVFRSVKYQNFKYTKRKTIHVDFSIEDYEKALDMRKFTKKSVSYILSNAIDEYLEISFKNLAYSNKSHENKSYFVRGNISYGNNWFEIHWVLPDYIEARSDNYHENYISFQDIKNFILKKQH